MKRSTFIRSSAKGILLCLLPALLMLGGCSGDDNPLKDDSGTINPSKDKQKVVENLTIEDATFSSDTFPENSTDDSAPVLSISSVDVVGIKAPGRRDWSSASQDYPSTMIAAPGQPIGKQDNTTIQSENAHTIIRIRPGQTINPVINFDTSLEDVDQAQVNVSIQDADGHFVVGKEAFFTPSSCRLKIKTSTNFRPGTFQIIVNITDNFLDVTSQNNVVIDVVVTGTPSDDANRLIVGKWFIKYQAPLPPYFSTDYRGNTIEFRENKTVADFQPDGTPISRGKYEIRTVDGISGIYFSDTEYREPTSGQWAPLPVSAKYRIEGLNLTTLMMGEIEGYGRALILEKQ